MPKSIHFFLFTILVSIFLPQTPSYAGERIALVVGNGGYLHTSPLANPPNDAEVIASTLAKAGFSVRKLIDADHIQMKRAMLEFGRSLRGDNIEAGLFYYAGHGVQVAGENYLVPVNARIADEDEIDLEAVNVNNFLRVMNSANSQINIVILDACRNNPFARSFRSVARGLAPVDAPKGTLIAYATAPGDVALDGDGNNSPYTIALAEAIASKGNQTIESVFKSTRRNVLAATEERQVPWETSSVTGDFYFYPDSGPSSVDQSPQENKPSTPAVVERADTTPRSRTKVIQHQPLPVIKGERCYRHLIDIADSELCVSSVLDPQSGNKYGGSNLVDNRLNTAWVEGVSGDGVGEFLSIAFDQEQTVQELSLRNGYNKNRNTYRKNGRVKEVVVRTSTGRQETFTLQDSGQWQTLHLQEATNIRWLSITISAVYRGSKYRDTAISELRVR